MSPDTELALPTRLGLLVFLWAVLAILTWLAVGKMLPHMLGWPPLGWVVLVFAVPAFVSLYLGAFSMSARVLSGRYPGDLHEDR